MSSLWSCKLHSSSGSRLWSCKERLSPCPGHPDFAVLIADINAVLNLGCTISTPTPAVVTESKNRARLNPATHNRALVSTAPAQLASASLTVEAPQPLITSAENAASFQDGAVAPGEVVSLSVTGLGPVTPTGFTLDRAGDIATSLEGVEVPFDGTPAPLTHVSATRITCVVPYEVHSKRSTDIRVSYQGLDIRPLFSLFRRRQSGTLYGQRFRRSRGCEPGRNLQLVGQSGCEGQHDRHFRDGRGTNIASWSYAKGHRGVAASCGASKRIHRWTIGVGRILWRNAGTDFRVLQLHVRIPSNVPSGDVPISVTVGGNAPERSDGVRAEMMPYFPISSRQVAPPEKCAAERDRQGPLPGNAVTHCEDVSVRVAKDTLSPARRPGTSRFPRSALTSADALPECGVYSRSLW